MTDLLHRRYHDTAAILALDAEEGISLLIHAMEAEETERLFQRWINGYQHMSFDAFRAELTPKPDKPVEEIMEDVGNIMRAWEVTRSHADF